MVVAASLQGTVPSAFGDTTQAPLDFHNADLTGAFLYAVDLTNADFTGAILRNTFFLATTGFSFPQLASTSSYQQKDLTGVNLADVDVSGWDFSGQLLPFASFGDVTDTNFNGATINGDPTVWGTNFWYSNLTFAQLASTASYQHKNLFGVVLGGVDVAGWNLSGQDLTNVDFQYTTLTSTDISNAVIQGTNWTGSHGLTFEKLASTASYRQKDLSFIDLDQLDVSGWNLAGQNMTHSHFYATTFASANLTGANFAQASLNNVDFRNAIGFSPNGAADIRNTIMPDGSVSPLALTSNGDVLTVRNDPTPITIKSSATFNHGSNIAFVLSSDWTSPVIFDSGLTVSLDGSVTLEFAPGVDPLTLVGDTFQLFRWNGPLAPGNEFVSIVTPPDTSWDLSQLYATGQVTLTDAPEPAVMPALSLVALLFLNRPPRRM